ncbi:hypothetical protein [Flavobacterium luteolum]
MLQEDKTSTKRIKKSLFKVIRIGFGFYKISIKILFESPKANKKCLFFNF